MENYLNISKLKVSNNTLKRYRDLDYKVWYAISEFVDNSLHSYLENLESLNRIGISKCEVLINLDEKSNTLIIEDNAGGVHPSEFERLLSVGVPKKESKYQLSEFGMGMKTASIWLGNNITITTKHFELQKTYRISIQIENTDDEVSIKEVPNSSGLQGYTRIEISSLNRNLSHKRTVSKTKESLASIFKKYIESNKLDIIFQGETLSTDKFSLMKNNDGSEMRKDFKIELSSGKTAYGWIGLLDAKSTSASRAGFSIYRFERLLMGYPDNTWKPSEIFSKGQSQVRTMLIGEIDMSEFKSSHTKNAINFVGTEEEEFLEQLKVSCGHYGNEKFVRSLSVRVKNIESHKTDQSTIIANSIFDKTVQNEQILKVEEVVFEVEKSNSGIEEFIKDNDIKDLDPISEFGFLTNSDYETYVEVYEFYSSTKPYMMVANNGDVLGVYINVGHKYFKNVVQMSDLPEEQTRYKLNCLFDALSEFYISKRDEKINPDQVRLLKSILLKNYAEEFSIE